MDTKTEKELAEIRQATRELHEAIKDSKQAKRDLLQAVGEVQETVNELIEVAVINGLTQYSEALNRAIKEATEAVYRRFDHVANILLGEHKTRKNRRQYDDMTLEQIAIKMRELDL